MPIEKKALAKHGSTVIKTSVKSSADKVVKTAPKKEKPIKYADKSGGQPELIPVFNSIKALMKP